MPNLFVIFKLNNHISSLIMSLNENFSNKKLEGRIKWKLGLLQI